MVGHHDSSGGGNSSWNAAHMSRSCRQADLVATDGQDCSTVSQSEGTGNREQGTGNSASERSLGSPFPLSAEFTPYFNTFTGGRGASLSSPTSALK